MITRIKANTASHAVKAYAEETAKGALRVLPCIEREQMAALKIHSLDALGRHKGIGE